MRALRVSFAFLVLGGVLAVLGVVPALAQLGGGGAAPPPPEQLVRIAATPVDLAAGGSATAVVRLTIAPTWHANANPPSPDYMIPTTLSVKGAAGITTGKPKYPPPHMLKVEFDEQPLAVYNEVAEIDLPLVAAKDAKNGRNVLKGTLRFQACNDQVCLAPASLPVEIVVNVTGGSALGPVAATTATTPESTTAAAAPESTATDTATLAVTPVRSIGGAAVASNPLAEALGHGGLIAFLALFGIGLALNLTPCVYPMLGVTVSIFGARTATSTVRVFFAALVYVLGITTMYSTLGVAAALTGGIFGAFLQNPLVLAGIGVLLLAMSLSMFGLYELQPPAWLLSKLGGNTGSSVIGLFLSGLLVGVFAAPCVGPPVVALLAIVGAKADPWFGFLCFFTLALGLGAPYLVLGTFSGLLQKLPRSGDWMVWVKKVFGVVLVSLGVFYVLIAFAPAWAMWVAPAALIAGGAYLGFLETSAAKRRGFTLLKRAGGLASVALGVWLVASAPRKGLEFQPYDAALVQKSLASGRPVILDFSADWCIPCHELERSTFTDRRVIAAARGFDAFKVDLTKSDSPEAQQRVRQYQVPGVPTVVFLAPDGREVQGARFSGFLPPDRFLEKMRMVTDGAGEVGGAPTPRVRTGG